MSVRVGIFGATGYTGYELVRLLMGHSAAHIAWATSDSYAGHLLSDVYPCPWDLPLIPADNAPLKDADLAFLCLPHGASMETAKRCLDAGLRVVDLSADFRLSEPTTYELWYKIQHIAPELLSEAVYGLTELYREQLRQARLVANPGCYPTSVLLGLYPLVRHGLLASDRVIVDAKSGVSGAGRTPKLTTHFVEAHDNLSPYNIGHVHRHVPEMEQELRKIGEQGTKNKLTVVFAPHLLPVNRGLLSTMYVELREGWPAERLVELYRETYAGEPFIQVLPAGRLATLRHVVHTNRCAISLTPVEDTHWIVCSAIDNLIKGASGQAVQNMNVMFGLDETLGLGM